MTLTCFGCPSLTPGEFRYLNPGENEFSIGATHSLSRDLPLNGTFDSETFSMRGYCPPESRDGGGDLREGRGVRTCPCIVNSGGTKNSQNDYQVPHPHDGQTERVTSRDRVETAERETERQGRGSVRTREDKCGSLTFPPLQAQVRLPKLFVGGCLFSRVTCVNPSSRLPRAPGQEQRSGTS